MANDVDNTGASTGRRRSRRSTYKTRKNNGETTSRTPHTHKDTPRQDNNPPSTQGEKKRTPSSYRGRGRKQEKEQRDNSTAQGEIKNTDSSSANKTNKNNKGEKNKNSRNRNNRRNSAHNRAKNALRTARGRSRNQGKAKKATKADIASLPVSDETSAGGLVISGLAESVDAQGRVDLNRVYAVLIGRVDRRGRLLWSMPKGHVEEGEAYTTTAEREVWEETGIYGTCFEEIGTIDYWFVSDGVRIHKNVHHHLLRYVDGDLNDEDPEVTEVAWFPVTQLANKLSYADERTLARTALKILPQCARAEKEAGRVTPR